MGERVTEADIWAYATRILTDPASYKADVSALALEATVDAVGVVVATIAGYLDTEIAAILADVTGIAGAAMRGTDSALLAAHFDIAAFEKCQAPVSGNAAVSWAVTTADRSLGLKSIIVDIPAGATIISVIAVARINIMNNAATAQKIDLKFEVEGTVLFNQTDVIGFGAVDGASGCYVIAEDATGEVTADAQSVQLEAMATLSAAASVRFQAQYYLFITYKMG